MPVRLTQESLTIAAPRLEPVPIGPTLPASYPLPELSITAPAASLEVEVLRLQNEFIRVGVAPSLGGRIVEVVDLRSDVEIFSLPPEIQLEPGGPRGFDWNHGIRWRIAPNWPNQLGPVDFRLIEPADPDAKGAIFLFDWQSELSVHTAITLAPNRAEFLIEQSIFNRAWTSASIWAGLDSALSPLRIRDAIELARGDSGIALFAEQAAVIEPGGVGSPMFRLGGRRTFAWQARVTVFSEIPGARAHSREASAGIEGSQLFLQTHLPETNRQIYLLANGQTFESTLPETPSATVATDLSALGAPEGIALGTSGGERQLLWPPRHEDPPALPPQSDLWQRIDDLIAGQAPGDFYLREPGLEPYAAWITALKAIESGDGDAADSALERYLGFNAEDPLAWWLKASVAREFSLPIDENSPELPNAHFIAPLEPLLKTEAFLRTPVQEGMGPSPLIAGIAANPPQSVGIVGIYAECGLRQGMARLADELLRHREFPLLHYLIGAQYLSLSKGETTAAEHVSRAAKLMIEPPFPARNIEIDAVLALARRFPSDPNLQVYVDLARRSQGLD